MGDFGVGVRKDSPTRRQQKVANALRRAIDTYHVRLILTTGDNIYAGTRLMGIPIGGSGDEDDDWSLRISAVPLRDQSCACVSIDRKPRRGRNRRARRSRPGRRQLLSARAPRRGEEAAGRASFCPGLFYRFRYGSDIEFVCLDTSKEGFFRGTGSSSTRSTGSSSSCRFRRPGAGAVADSVLLTIRRTAPGRSMETRRGWSVLCRCSSAQE